MNEFEKLAETLDMLVVLRPDGSTSSRDGQFDNICARNAGTILRALRIAARDERHGPELGEIEDLRDEIARAHGALRYLKSQAENGTLHPQVVIQNARNILETPALSALKKAREG